jgi:hypothetical protein
MTNSPERNNETNGPEGIVEIREFITPPSLRESGERERKRRRNEKNGVKQERKNERTEERKNGRTEERKRRRRRRERDIPPKSGLHRLLHVSSNR